LTTSSAKFDPPCDPVDGIELGGALFDSVDDPEFAASAFDDNSLGPSASATCLSQLWLHPPHRRALQVSLAIYANAKSTTKSIKLIRETVSYRRINAGTVTGTRRRYQFSSRTSQGERSIINEKKRHSPEQTKEAEFGEGDGLVIQGKGKHTCTIQYPSLSPEKFVRWAHALYVTQ
jgi:hypothetical protein